MTFPVRDTRIVVPLVEAFVPDKRGFVLDGWVDTKISSVQFMFFKVPQLSDNFKKHIIFYIFIY